MTTVKQTVTALETAIAELEERAHRAAEQLERTTKRLEAAEARFSRGTGDHMQDLIVAEWSPVPTRPDITPPPMAPVADLATALERVLRAAPIGAADAALSLGIPVAHVVMALRTLRRAKKVTNAGTSEAPLWTWVLGDECTTTELTAKVEQLIRARPMSLQELVDATGARRNRLSGAIVLLRRHGLQVVNQGNGFRAIWHIPSK